MLFTTSINLAIFRSVRGRNSGVDRVCNWKTNHDRRAINRFVKKMGFTRRKVRMTSCIFLEGTLLILITYHLRNELKRQNKGQAYNALVTFVVLRFENVNKERCDMIGKLLFLQAGTGNRGKYLSLLSSLLLRYNSRRLPKNVMRETGRRIVVGSLNFTENR